MAVSSILIISNDKEKIYQSMGFFNYWTITVMDAGAPYTLHEIKGEIDAFIRYACLRVDTSFKVTRVANGFNNFSDEDIAPMFQFAPFNCVFPAKWKSIVPSVSRRYWTC